MTHPTSIRLPDDVKQRLDDHARATGETPSAAAIRLIDEGLRMAAHPGIFFQTSGSGVRIPRLRVGPKIVNVVDVLTELEATGDKRIAEAAEWFSIHPSQIQIAIDYWAAHRDEIDAMVAHKNEVAAEEQARYEAGQTLLS